MFERFTMGFAPLRDEPSAPRSVWLDDRLVDVAGYPEFAVEFGGASFAGGLYRVHDTKTGPRALASLAEDFPEFAARARPFGYDWLGRHFAVDFDRVDSGLPQVLLLEPGTGDALEIPTSFAAFHDEELVDYTDAALAADFFESWSRLHPNSLPLARNLCIGYRDPLFLGGKDVVTNLELSDLEVYWSICGNLRRGTLTLPPGTSINQVIAER
jgi:hypothetical protein